MSSIWTDLLSLHGYLVRREDLRWRDDGSVAGQTAAEPGKSPSEPQSTNRPRRRLLPWPRLAAPH